MSEKDDENLPGGSGRGPEGARAGSHDASRDTADSQDADDSGSKKGRAKPRPKERDRTTTRPLVGEVDERAVDAPSRQTLFMLGVICVSTLIMWAAGRAACNYHVPGESLTPRDVSLEDRTRTPKGVAIEFAQAMSGADFDVAEKLAVQDAVGHVKRKKQKCEDCDDQRDAQDDLLSVPVVLDATGVDSLVRVETTGGPHGPVERLLRIQRSREEGWKVTGVLDPQAELPELNEPPVERDSPQAVRRVPPKHGEPPENQPERDPEP